MRVTPWHAPIPLVSCQMNLDEANKKLSDYAGVIDSLNKKVPEMGAGKNIDDLEERIEEMEGKLKKRPKPTT